MSRHVLIGLLAALSAWTPAWAGGSAPPGLLDRITGDGATGVGRGAGVTWPAGPYPVPATGANTGLALIDQAGADVAQDLSDGRLYLVGRATLPGPLNTTRLLIRPIGTAFPNGDTNPYYAEVWRLRPVRTGDITASQSANVLEYVDTNPIKRIKINTVEGLGHREGLHVFTGTAGAQTESLAGTVGLGFVPHMSFDRDYELAIQFFGAAQADGGYFITQLNGRTIHYDPGDFDAAGSPNRDRFWLMNLPYYDNVEWRVYPNIETWEGTIEQGITRPHLPQVELDADDELFMSFGTAITGGGTGSQGDFIWSGGAGGSTFTCEPYTTNNAQAALRHVFKMQGASAADERTALTVLPIGTPHFARGRMSIVLGDALARGAAAVEFIVYAADDETELVHLKLNGATDQVSDELDGSRVLFGGPIGDDTHNAITATFGADGTINVWCLDLTRQLFQRNLWSDALAAPAGWTGGEDIGRVLVRMTTGDSADTAGFSYVAAATVVGLLGIDSLCEATLTETDPALSRNVSLGTMFGKMDEIACIPGGWRPEQGYGLTPGVALPVGRAGRRIRDQALWIVPGLEHVYGVRFIKMTMSVNDVRSGATASEILADTQTVLQAYLANGNEVWLGTDVRRELNEGDPDNGLTPQQNAIIDVANAGTLDMADTLQTDDLIRVSDVAGAIDDDPATFPDGPLALFAESGGLQEALHPTEDGYAIWKDLFVENLRLAGAAGCPADLDQSGSVGFYDLLLLLTVWGPCTCPEDFDASGNVGFSDLVFLLGSWGPCP